MKKLIQTLALALSAGILPAQNYIQNGDLEAGTAVTGILQLDHATGWSGLTCPSKQWAPDLFDVNSTNCLYTIPTNKWAYNTPVHSGGNRYLGVSGSATTGAVASLSTLPTNCYNYNLQFWVHTIDGYYPTGSTGCSPAVTAPYYLSRVQVSLYNSSNCSSVLVFDSPDINQSANWQLLSTAFTLTPAQASAGYNKIQIKIVRPRGVIPAPNTSGQILFMDDFSLTGNTDLTPHVTVSGNGQYCNGSPITAVGTYSGTSTPTVYDWAINECDASGNFISGGYAWDHWVAGAPSSSPFTFPTSTTLACGKFYMIRFITVNGCVTWAEADQIIFLNCTPTPVITGNAVDCQNVSDQLCVNYAPAHFIRVNWSPVSATTQCITVNPSTTTTYTVNVNDLAQGCSASATFTVAVAKNDPSFTGGTTYVGPTYNNVLFTPQDLNAQSQPGFGFEWFIDEMDNTGTVVVNAFHGSMPCTWSSLPTNFPGFDGTASPVVAPCAGGTGAGKFKNHTNYLITRGTWNNKCGWNSMTYSYRCDPPPVANGGTPVITFERIATPAAYLTKPEAAGDQLAETKPTIYPNPANGLFKVAFAQDSEGTLEVYDATGKRIRVMEMKAGALEYEFDLSDSPKGMYFLNVIANGKKYSEKIIIQ